MHKSVELRNQHFCSLMSCGKTPVKLLMLAGVSVLFRCKLIMSIIREDILGLQPLDETAHLSYWNSNFHLRKLNYESSLKKAFIRLHKKRYSNGHKSISADSFASTEPSLISENAWLILKTGFTVPSLCRATYDGCLWTEIRLMRKTYITPRAAESGKGHHLMLIITFFLSLATERNKTSEEEQVMQHGFSLTSAPCMSQSGTVSWLNPSGVH